MDNTMEAMSYVTYEYNVYPRKVEKHASSNVVETPINGADIKIRTESKKMQRIKNIILCKIQITNEGNSIAKELQFAVALTNVEFITGSVSINGYNLTKYIIKDGFFFNYLNPKDSINITFKIKSNKSGDIASVISGFYYFLSCNNEKVYRRILSNLTKITLNYSHLVFDVQCNNISIGLNQSKNITIHLKNVGNKQAKNIKFNILLPYELKLNTKNIFVNDKLVSTNDKHGFLLEDLKENETKKINISIDYVAFKGRCIVPFIVFCSFYNINEQNIYEQYDSEIIKLSTNLMPNKDI